MQFKGETVFHSGEVSLQISMEKYAGINMFWEKIRIPILNGTFPQQTFIVDCYSAFFNFLKIQNVKAAQIGFKWFEKHDVSVNQ